MASYSPNYAAVGRWLASDNQLNAAIHSQAGLIATRARVIAHVRTGRYKASIEVRSSRWTPRRGGPRLAADVIANVPYATVVEDRYHTLRRAADGS